MMKLLTTLCSFLLVTGCLSDCVTSSTVAKEEASVKVSRGVAAFQFDSSSDEETLKDCFRVILSIEEVYGKHDSLDKEPGGIIVSWDNGKAVAICSLEEKGLIFTTEIVKQEQVEEPPAIPGMQTL